ncbi:hypothetical protein [uncultured Vibrio sp.]|nr:hypothetical protein [uncultured Vibrio sp.]
MVQATVCLPDGLAIGAWGFTEYRMVERILPLPTIQKQGITTVGP